MVNSDMRDEKVVYDFIQLNLCLTTMCVVNEDGNPLEKKEVSERVGLSPFRFDKVMSSLEEKSVASFCNMGGLDWLFADPNSLGYPESDVFDWHGVLSILRRESFGKNKEHNLLRIKREKALINDLSTSDKVLISGRFGERCALTGKAVPIQFDHVIPVSSGHGGTTLSNMLPIWQRINSSKGAKNIFEWYEENGDRFEVLPELFDQAIEYLADLNEMTAEEYRDYVYECHANPIDYLTEVDYVNE